MEKHRGTYVIAGDCLINLHYPPVIKRIYDFTRLRNALTDIQIIVGSQTYKAHKIIIAESSDYFLAAFTSWNKNIIKLDNIDPDLFEELLNIIYGSEIKTYNLRTLELIKMMNYFQIKYVNLEEIIEAIKINDFEFQEYIMLLNDIYPNGITEEIVPYIKDNMTNQTDISFLSIELQKLLRS